MSRNPKWTRDEIILALELYFRVNPVHNSETHDEIVGLSNLLNDLPLHPQDRQQETFRNPNSVHMKLRNFLRFDKRQSKKGLEAGSKLDEEIWHEFSTDRKRLKKTANLIKEYAKWFSPPRGMEELISDKPEHEFAEGQILTRVHKLKENNVELNQKKRRSIIQATGKLACEVCAFDFFEIYGESGKGFAECHYIKPLSQLDRQSRAKLADLAIVCSNCHSMLRLSKPWKTIDDLRSVVQGQTTIFSRT